MKISLEDTTATSGQIPAAKLFRTALALGLSALELASFSSTALAGNIFLSGHDPDFHASQGPNSAGAQHVIQLALNYARNGNTAPILLLETDLSNLSLGDHADSELGLIASGFTAGNTPGNHYVKVSASQFASVNLAQFSAIFVPSDHGGTLTGNDLQALNARAADIANFVNLRGGVVALAEEGVRQPATTGPQPQNYGFVPLPVTSAPLPWFDYPFTVTAAGTAWGLQNSDINDYAAHSYFIATAGMDVLDVDPSGRAMSLALQVPVPAPCTPPASGLVSWWRAEGNTLDQVGGNNGTLVGTTTYGPGEVGQGFVFDGDSDAVRLGNPASLQLQNFTFETWIRRADPTIVTHYGNGVGVFLAGGTGCYQFDINNAGNVFAGRIDVDGFTVGPPITDTNWHHVAATKSGTSVVLYIDGAGYAGPPYAGIFAFTTPIGIGARGDDLTSSFLGTIDEMGIYNRALTASEIQAIYTAGSFGKCPTPVGPSITSQPVDVITSVGGSATFNVLAAGTIPLSYQWLSNNAPMPGQTNTSLVLSSAQAAYQGQYSVLVTNMGGSISSSNALLTVLVPQNVCTPPPSGLVSWWRAEGNTLDQVGGNNGTLAGTTSYGPGEVGQGFVFHGNSDAVRLGNPASLQLQNFTFETWIRRADPTIVTHFGNGVGVFLAGGTGCYQFDINNAGKVFVGRIDVDGFTVGPPITDTNWHHVAATKSGADVVLYIDGVGYAVPPYTGIFAFTTPIAIGARGDDLTSSFLGTIDEMGIYNRALTASEIQAIYTAGSSGKCPTPVAPSITSQPVDVITSVGGTATFNVLAAGSISLSYQWVSNNVPMPGQTNTSLVLSDVRPAYQGQYSVLVTNIGGSISSSNVLLTVLVPHTNCTPAPAGLVSWWRAEGNTLDQVGGNNGTLVGTATYGPGEVGQGFVFHGNSDAVRLGNPASLQLQNFTFETWIRRADPAIVTHYANGVGVFLAGGTGCYQFDINNAGNVFVGRIDVDGFTVGPPITDTNWHHVAATKSGTSVVLYIDGVGYAGPPYTDTFTFTTPISIGARGDDLTSSFLGTIDEMGIYDRALTASEIQAIYTAGSFGKCPGNIPPVPVIEVSPLAQFPGYTNLIVIAPDGLNASVTFDGSKSYDLDDANFYYFWYEGTNLLATNAVTTQTLSVGTHEITLLLDDTFPMGTNSASVTVEVITPAESIGILIGLVDNSSLPRNTKRPLIATLNAAVASFERGNTLPGINQLMAFQNKVRARLAPFDPVLANELIGATQTIIKALGAR